MRIKRKTLIQVGLFVAAGLAATFFAILLIGRERSLFGKTYILIAPFKDVSGLRNGAQVQLAGLNVGYVDGVRFSKGPKQVGLDVILRISFDFKEFIRKDSVASIQTQGLLGDKFILITRGSSTQPALADGDPLGTEGVGGISAIADKGKQMMDEITLTAKRFREVLDKFPADEADKESMKNTVANLEQSSADLSAILAGLNKGEGTFGALLKDPALYHDLRALLGRANRSKLLKNLIRATIAEQEKETQQPVK